MKKIFSIMCFLLLMTAGCSQVVYRVNPDSPPKMSIEEARSAIELSLSLVMRNTYLESINMDGDNDLVIVAPMGYNFAMRRFTATLANIDREIRKYKDYFGVSVYGGRAVGASSTEIIFWKSEEDARLFVDAVHAIQQGRLGKKPVTTHIAASSFPSPQKDVHRQSSQQAELTSKSERVSLPSSSSTGSMEKAAPKIIITSPDLNRSLKLIAKESRINVIGIAESKDGIAEVTINGLTAELDEQGNFSRDILLRVGQNAIVVGALDVHGRKTINSFTIHRESGKIAQSRKESVILSPGIPSANYHALFIAVQEYDSRDISRLDFTISDARQLRDVLISNYTFERGNTILLENPDRRAIYKTLQSLRNKLGEKDNLLIFYAGHGYWLDDMKQGFWLPRDASGINDPSDWIPNSTIRDYIKAIKAKHILLVADACFGGGIFKVREAFQKKQISVEKIYELPSRKAITSGSLKTVPDRSVFLEYFLKRLQENNETYLDTQKLFASFREAVINNSPTHQTPLYGAINEAGDEGGDFVFVRRQ